MYELEPGASLGKYQILRKLADGGMAEIYLARIGGTAGFEKLVVVKRIAPGVADDRALVAMFLDEARLAATLRHANIAEVIDVGSDDNAYFFAMEYVYGQDARNIRYEARELQQVIPLEIALAIVCGTASALAYAHDKRGPDGPLGLVHRDVSPSNILVSYDGAVKLVDFGIARATSRTTQTLTGILKGKVPYMSPEQCRGKVLDRRSDLFSLGIVLYELTTGQRPFAGGGEYETLEQIAIGSAAPPRTVAPGYPPALEAIVMKMLERDLTRRYQTADEVLVDLEALIAARGVFMSALGVAKYMRELFAKESGAWEEASGQGQTLAHHLARQTGPSAIRSNATPALQKNAQWFAAESSSTARSLGADVDFHSEDETTAAFDRHNKRYISPMRRATTETTNADIVSPFDPIEVFSAELLEELDEDAPSNEPKDARTRRRIDTLVDRAFACYGAGELDKAVTAVELAMTEDEGSPTAQRLVHRHRDTIKAILDAFVGAPAQIPALARDLKDLEAQPQLQRCAFLMSRIDGRANLEELVHSSGLSPLETYRQLCTLILRGAIVLHNAR